MKNFKSFIAEEKPNIKRKAKGEQDFVDAHEIEITDPTDQKNNSAKVTTKAGSGKHKNDREDNKQEFGEDTGQADARKTTPSSKEAQQKVFDKHRERMKQLAKEEIDLEEETQTYMVKFEKDGKVSLKNYEAKSDLDARSKAKVDAKRIGMTVASVRLKEEVEELDEISKKTLGSYISKAAVDMTHKTSDATQKRTMAGANYAHNISRGMDTKTAGKRLQADYDDAKPDTKKAVKRMYGIDKAVSRMTKEEVEELDEEQLREFDLQTEAAYTNPGLERLAAAKKRNQPSHTNPGLEALAKKKKSLRQMKEEMGIGSINEADFSKQQTKMAHTIGKEFEKKGVGDESQGGPYAIASAMVRDKPEAAQKAYKTIQSKMKEETDAELLFNLYNDLNEENQEMFMSQLEEDAESLLQFAKNFLAD
jgi:hypothetical protein